MKALPAFNQYGFLPEGIHTSTLPKLEPVLKTNPCRERLWSRLTKFVSLVEGMGSFSYAYLGGGFVSMKESPSDIDLIVETAVEFSPSSLKAMIPLFEIGLGKIHQNYSVHLHFWAPGFPGEMNDFRCFFQYTHPKEQKRLPVNMKKGIVRFKLKATPQLKVQCRDIAPHLYAMSK